MKVIDKSECCGCGACAEICPKTSIQMIADAEGFLYPSVDEATCVSCGLCEKVCPVLRNAADTDGTPQAFAAKNRQESVRMESSSGGVFTLLAEEVLSSGGIVIGAAFTEDYREVAHRVVEEVCDLSALRGSKYIQSDTNGMFLQVKNALRAGRKVLFSGTPCQCEGLLSFLGEKDDNLIVVDIICHGVPSPKLWRKYVDYRQEHFAERISGVRFRDKRSGWKSCEFVMQFDKDEFRCVNQDDPYMQMFLQDICLRPSCHICKFKKFYRASDITMADFWGIDEVLPEINDNKGVSLVMTHTEKGKQLLNSLTTKMEIYEVDAQIAIKNNQAMTRAYPAHPKRGEFFRQMDVVSFPKLYDCYVKPKLTIKRIIKALLRRLGLMGVVKRAVKR